MIVLKEKFQKVNNQITSLLFQLRNINVGKVNEIPNQIKNVVFGADKTPTYLDGTITFVEQNDLNNLTLIGDSVFAHYNNLISVTIPGSVQSIGNLAFFDCNSLIDVTIPGSVQSIGNSAFARCSSLTSITIPNSVQSIGSNAFENCDKIKTVYLNCSIPPSLGNINSMPQNAIIHVPIGSGNAYKSATNWSYYANYIIEDVKI